MVGCGKQPNNVTISQIKNDIQSIGDVTVEDKDYALLSVVQEDTLPVEGNDEDEIIIMKMNKTDDECTFEIIEDDEMELITVNPFEDKKVLREGRLSLTDKYLIFEGANVIFEFRSFT